MHQTKGRDDGCYQLVKVGRKSTATTPSASRSSTLCRQNPAQVTAGNRSFSRNRPPTVQQLSMTTSSSASNLVLIGLVPVANPVVSDNNGQHASTYSFNTDNYVHTYAHETNQQRDNVIPDTTLTGDNDNTAYYSQHTPVNTGYYSQTCSDYGSQNFAVSGDYCTPVRFDSDDQQSSMPVFQSFDSMMNVTCSAVAPSPASTDVSMPVFQSFDSMMNATCSAVVPSPASTGVSFTCSSTTVIDSVSADSHFNLMPEPEPVITTTLSVADIEASRSQVADLSRESSIQLTASGDGVATCQPISSQNIIVSTDVVLGELSQPVDTVSPSHNSAEMESSQSIGLPPVITNTVSAANSNTAVIVTNLKSASSIVVSDSQLVLPQNNAPATNVDATVNVGLTGGPVILLTATQLRQLGISVSMLPLTTVSTSRISAAVENTASSDVVTPNNDRVALSSGTGGTTLCDVNDVGKRTVSSNFRASIVSEHPFASIAGESTSTTNTSYSTALTLGADAVDSSSATVADSVLVKSLDCLLPTAKTSSTSAVASHAAVYWNDNMGNTSVQITSATSADYTLAYNRTSSFGAVNSEPVESDAGQSLISQAFSSATGIPEDELKTHDNENLTVARVNCDTIDERPAMANQVQCETLISSHNGTSSSHETASSIDVKLHTNDVSATVSSADIYTNQSDVLVNTDMYMSSVDIAMLNGSLSPSNVCHSVDLSLEANNYDTLQTPKKPDLAPVMQTAQLKIIPSLSLESNVQPVTSSLAVTSFEPPRTSPIQPVTSMPNTVLQPGTAWSQPSNLVAQPMMSLMQPVVTITQPLICLSQTALTVSPSVIASMPVVSSSQLIVPTSCTVVAASQLISTSQPMINQVKANFSAHPLTSLTDTLVSSSATLLVSQSTALNVDPVTVVSQSPVTSCPRVAQSVTCSTISDLSLNTSQTAVGNNSCIEVCSKNSCLFGTNKSSQAIGLHSRSPLKRYSPGFRPILPGEQKISPSKSVSPSLPKVKPVKKVKRVQSAGLMPIAPKGFIIKATQMSPVKKTAASLTAKARQRKVKDYQKRSTDGNSVINQQHPIHILPKPFHVSQQATAGRSKQAVSCRMIECQEASTGYVDMPLLEDGTDQCVVSDDDNVVDTLVDSVEVDECDDDVDEDEDDDDEDEEDDSAPPQDIPADDPNR